MEKELLEKLIILLIITLSCANLVFSIYNFYTIRESTKKIDDLEGFKKYIKNEFQIFSSKVNTIIQEKMDESEVFKKNITNELELFSFNLSNITQEKMDELEVLKTNIANEFQLYSSNLSKSMNELKVLKTNITNAHELYLSNLNKCMDELNVFKTNITNELKLYSSKRLKINSGTFEFGWETSFNYYLHKSQYAKSTYSFSIYFPESYSNIPKVYVTLIKFDFSNTENTRVGLNVIKITSYRFEVEIYTWANSRVFQGEISWLSYGI